MRNDVCYEKRFRHKLNLLEPGLVVMRVVALLAAAGGIGLLMQWMLLARIAFALSGVLFVGLMVLVGVEQYQDRVLNELAQREMTEKEQ